MSIPPFKKFKNDHGEAVELLQGDPDSTGANTKRKRAPKPLNLLELSYDCLHEVFNLKRVSVLDLAMLAQTCTTLQELATDIFARSHRMCNFTSMALADAVMVDRVLSIFGSSIFHISIDFTPYALDAVEIIDSILGNCTELRSLHMESYEIPDCPIAFAKLRLLFAKLNSLRIEYVSIEGWEGWADRFNYYSYCRSVTPNGNVINIFADSNSLVDFKVVNSFALEKVIFQSQFGKLKHFLYKDASDHIMVKGVSGFIFRHRNLKTLILGDNIKIAETFELISANCTQLQQLEFGTDAPTEMYGTALTQLGKLKHLEKLKVEWYSQNMVPLLKEFQASTSLRELELDSTLGSSDLIPTIAQIKTLRVLKLSYTDGLQNLRALRDLTQLVELFITNLNLTNFDFDLVSIIERLVNLKKIKFDISCQRQYRISKDIYLQIVNIIEKRPVNNRFLEVFCRKTRDFEDSLHASVPIYSV